MEQELREGGMEQRLRRISFHLGSGRQRIQQLRGHVTALGKIQTSVCAQAAGVEQIREADSSSGLLNMFVLDVRVLKNKDLVILF